MDIFKTVIVAKLGVSRDGRGGVADLEVEMMEEVGGGWWNSVRVEMEF